MSSSVLSSLKHEEHPSVLDLIKHEVQIYSTASKSSSGVEAESLDFGYS